MSGGLAPTLSSYFFFITINDLDKLNGKLINSNCGSTKSLNLNETYTCPSNGYVYIRNLTNYMGYVSLYSSNGIGIGALRPITTIQSTTAEATCFVRKGTKLRTGGVAFDYCAFVPLEDK